MQGASLFNGISSVSNKSAATLLFSGGRDSTAAAVILGLASSELHLLSFKSGFAMDELDLRELRRKEFEDSGLPAALHFHTVNIRALVREIALIDLVSDIQRDGCQLILLGEALSMFAAAVVYMRRHNLRNLAYGATSYQSHYPEQHPVVIEALRGFLQRWNITLLTPGIDWNTEKEPKDILRNAGLSTKSLESISMFADIDDLPHVDASIAYMERKTPVFTKYIERSR